MSSPTADPHGTSEVLDDEAWLKHLEQPVAVERPAATAQISSSHRPTGLPDPSGRLRPDGRTTRLVGLAALHRSTLDRLRDGYSEGWFSPDGGEARVFSALCAAAESNPDDDYGTDALVGLDLDDAWVLHQAVEGLASDADQRRRHADMLVAALRDRHWVRHDYTPAATAVSAAVGDGRGDPEAAWLDLQSAMARRPAKPQQLSRFLTFAVDRLANEPTEQPAIAYTGFETLDRLLGWESVEADKRVRWHRGGLRQGSLVLVCGPSSSGKTTFSLEMMARAHRARCETSALTRRTGMACMVFTAEMTPVEIIDRWGLVDPAKQRLGEKNRWWAHRRFDKGDGDWLADDDESDFYIIYKHDERAGVQSVDGIIGFVRDYVQALTARYLRLLPSAASSKDRALLYKSVLVRLPMAVCVDYLDVWLDDLGPERVVEAERAAAALKHQLALGAAFSGIEGLSPAWRPLVLLNVQAKLPDPDYKTGMLRAPTGNDIAWCRAVKNHCDVNLMIHRPWMSANPDSSEAYIVVEKNRFGRAGTARVAFADGLFSNPGDGPTWRGYADGYAVAELCG